VGPHDTTADVGSDSATDSATARPMAIAGAAASAAVAPLLPDHLVKNDPFEHWMVNGKGPAPVADDAFADGLRELRADPATATVQATVGPATYVDDLLKELKMPHEEDACLKAMGVRTLAQVARVDDQTARLIDEAVANHTGVDMEVQDHQATAASVIEAREAAWENDANWMDDLDVKDEEMKAELESLHQRARQEFDISALGGLAVKTDSLKSLKGIGDKLEMYLYAMGIRSYAQLSKLTPEIEARFDALVGTFPGRLTRANVVEQSLQKLQVGKEESGE
jgi:predicted flap endonuclease-1-like 5' DNA nuclease